MTSAGKALVSCQQRMSRQYQSKVEKNTCARSATSEDNTSTGSTWGEGREGRKMMERRKRGMRMVRRKTKSGGENSREGERGKGQGWKEEDGGGGREISRGREDHYTMVAINRRGTSSSFCSVGLCSSQCTHEVQASGSPQSQQPPPPDANSWGKKTRRPLSYQSHICCTHTTVNYYVYSIVFRPHQVPV